LPDRVIAEIAGNELLATQEVYRWTGEKYLFFNFQSFFWDGGVLYQLVLHIISIEKT
jgi:hypothetical protein